MLENLSRAASKAAMRSAAVAALRDMGFKVTNKASGAGSPPNSLVELSKGGARTLCALKLTTRPEGRIHFAREDDQWRFLGRVDQVLHVWHHPDEPESLLLTMFSARTVQEAFDANLEEATKGGFAHIPAWLSPKFEPAKRFVGSGFEKKAEWQKRISFPLPRTDLRPQAMPLPGSAAAPVAEGAKDEKALTAERKGEHIMDRIKEMLAEHMGVPAERIEIDVRVKF